MIALFHNSFFPEPDCNFDTSTCGFIQATNDDFDWTRRKGHTPSTGTGPSSDHTSGSGSLQRKLLFKEARKGFFGCYSVCETMKDTKEG